MWQFANKRLLHSFSTFYIVILEIIKLYFWMNRFVSVSDCSVGSHGSRHAMKQQCKMCHCSLFITLVNNSYKNIVYCKLSPLIVARSREASYKQVRVPRWSEITHSFCLHYNANTWPIVRAKSHITNFLPINDLYYNWKVKRELADFKLKSLLERVKLDTMKPRIYGFWLGRAFEYWTHKLEINNNENVSNETISKNKNNTVTSTEEPGRAAHNLLYLLHLSLRLRY